jgi:hypothetical protein
LIGVLSPLSAAEGVQNTNAFRSALRELGYIEGRNATVELRYANGEADRMGALARELVALKPDVLFAGSAPGLVAARNATRTIPIVTIVPEDPVASGIASSIARPSGNITGTWSLGDYALVGKRLDFLKLAVPGLARVAAIVNPDDPIANHRKSWADTAADDMVDGFDSMAMVGAIAAVIGGTVVFGSNTSTSKQAAADIKAAEALRAELIDKINLRLVGEAGGKRSDCLGARTALES